MDVHLQKYLDSGFNSVQGWCDRQLFQIIDKIHAVQALLDTKGGILEIGIHHGKFFILLNQVTEKSDISVAIDLFDQQNLNVDQSGAGNRDVFEQNLNLYDKHKGENVRILAMDSTSTDSRAFISDRFKMISVDGGHTAEHTLNDLYLALSWMQPQGVVIVDDIMNYHWPGVFEGVIRFLLEAPTLVPFAIGANKLLMCKLSYYAHYFGEFSASELKKKQVRLVGRELVAF